MHLHAGGVGLSTSRNKLGIGNTSICPSALAPMQDVTGLPFMTLIADRGPPDLFFTEFFRVHANSRLSPAILSSITDNPTDRPVFAQIIGENVDDITRTISDLNKYPVAGIDLNMGCPAPRVYKKNVGGGLLKDPLKIQQILQAMRSMIEGNLTVKMRIGFEDDQNFEEILKIISGSGVNLLSIHVRTVKGGYNSPPQYEYIDKATQFLADDCPILVNGSIESAIDACRLKNKLGVMGVMIGRAAIRNPWIFRQINEFSRGEDIFIPRRKDLYSYCIQLYEVLNNPGMDERKMVSRMKKFLNYIGSAIGDDGCFLKRLKRAVLKDELFSIFDEHLIDRGRSEIEIPIDSNLSSSTAVVNNSGCEF
jgi:tRNA-dihydrouridine synthase